MNKHHYTHPTPITLESGECLHSLEITYHTAGRFDPQKNSVIWVCHAFTADSNPSDWWEQLVGEQKFYNPTEHFIICANILGSCYGSTGPLSPSPDGLPYYDAFPLVSVRDLVQAHECLRQHLGIEKIHTLIGSSVGAFQALEWAVSSPSLIEHLICIAASAVVSPWASALNESQRLAIQADPSYYQGVPTGGSTGMKVARSIALLSYRSYSGYHQTQQEESIDFLVAQRAPSYQRYQGEKLAQRFSAYAYHGLTRTFDTHNVGRGRGGVASALARIQAQTLLIAIASDILFPPDEMQYMQAHIPHAHYECIDSDFGHDGFLIETDTIKTLIARWYAVTSL